MKKKIVVLILSFLTLFLLLNSARAQNEIPLPGGINTGQIENTTNQIGNAAGQFGQPNQYWTYIGNEIQKIILGNPITVTIDNFLHMISPAFVVLFGVPYSLSVSLLFIIALWTYFLLVINNILKNYASLSKWISRAVALLMVIIMAQFKLFEKQINLVIFLLFGDKPWWLKLIFGIIIVVILMLLFIYIKKFGKQIAIKRKKMKEEENRFKLEMGAKMSEVFGQTVGKSLEEEGK